MVVITTTTYIDNISMINVLNVKQYSVSTLVTLKATFGPWPIAAGTRSAVLEPPIPNHFIAGVILRCFYLWPSNTCLLASADVASCLSVQLNEITPSVDHSHRRCLIDQWSVLSLRWARGQADHCTGQRLQLVEVDNSFLLRANLTSSFREIEVERAQSFLSSSSQNHLIWSGWAFFFKAFIFPKPFERTISQFGYLKPSLNFYFLGFYYFFWVFLLFLSSHDLENIFKGPGSSPSLAWLLGPGFRAQV